MVLTKRLIIPTVLAALGFASPCGSHLHRPV